MTPIDTLRERFPEAARDIKLNLQAVLQPAAPLTGAQRWGVAVASAIAARQPILSQAVLATAREELGGGGDLALAILDDAMAAAALMAMNNVYYRFRHLVGKPAYQARPPRLRMNRIVKPKASKEDFELFCLAVSAIHGCGSCLVAHEAAVLAGGLTEEHVHEAVRIASTVSAAAVALELAELASPRSGSVAGPEAGGVEAAAGARAAGP